MVRPMIELRTLGELQLQRSNRRELCAILAQPKRLALLTYLAVSTRWQRRDSVVALFWPDLDTDHARGALRQALRFLRRELGHGVLNSRSEEELGFQRGTLWCDAAAFERACDAGRLAEALELYRGDFLDGFFVSGAAPEFDQWVTAKRARLKNLAVEAARTCAERCAAQGDAAAAIRWARWAFEVEPSPATQALMQTVNGRAKPPARPESPELALARAWFSAGWCGSCA
jgi:DNA-binding SARP family transcriptional activator